MSRSELKAGDLIGIVEIVRFAGERCTPVEVVTVEPHKIGARFLTGQHRGQPIALELSAENRSWRRR